MRRNDESGGVKLCRDCGEVKTLDNFYKESGKSSHRAWCKPCYGTRNFKPSTPESRAKNAEKMRAKRQAWSPEERKARYLKKNYNTTLDWFDAQWLTQGEGCAICGAEECESGRAMVVDHDHYCCETVPTCGKCNRGILCWGCNIGLGNFKDSVDIVRSAVQYLSQTQVEITCGKSGYRVYVDPRYLRGGAPLCPCHNEEMEEEIK